MKKLAIIPARGGSKRIPQKNIKQFGWKKGNFSVAEQYYEHCLSLPICPTLTDEEQEYVIEKVLEYII